MTLLILGFFIGFLTSIPPVGPVTAIVWHRAMVREYRRGLAFGLGSASPEGLYVLAAVYGTQLLFDEFPGLIGVFEWIAGLILMGVGIYLITREIDVRDAEDPELDTDDFRATMGKHALLGFMASAFNPTMIFTWTTIVGLLISVGGFEFTAWQKWGFAVAVVVGNFSWFTLFYVLARRWGARIDETLVGRLTRGIGGLLIGLGVWSGVKLLVG